MATYLEQIERQRKRRIFLQTMLCIIAIGFLIIGGICEYTTVSETTTICRQLTTEQHINEGYTTYTYLVTTDAGVFEITNKGLFLSPDFGKIEEGKEYTFKTRGISCPMLGVYPFIISVNEKSNE